MREKLKSWIHAAKKLNDGKPPYLILAIGCIVGLTVTFEAYFLIGKSNPTISTPRYLIAVREVGVGRTVTPIDFDLILQTDVKNPPKGAVSDQYLDKLRGAKIKISIKSREILTWDHVAARNDVAGSIPKGLRAYSLMLQSTVPLMGGDYVDVMASPKGKSTGSVLLLDKVLVVESVKERDQSQILLAISPQDVPALDRAREVGEIRLVLRNPEDTAKKGRRDSNFLNQKKRVEISEG